MNREIPEKATLENLYNKEYSIQDISIILDMSVGKIYKFFKLYNIPTRKSLSQKAKKQISKSNKGHIPYNKGKNLSEETKQKMSKKRKEKYSVGIGHKKQRKDGYIAIYFPEHPMSSKNGYIMEHDLIMECNIGRWLREDEVVHHKNHIKNDNRIENLQLMTFKEHARLHMLERKNKIKRGDDDLSIR